MKKPAPDDTESLHAAERPATGRAHRTSVGDLLRQLVDDVIALVQSEIRLASGEIRDNIAGAVGSLATVAAGLMLLSVAMLCLLGALVVVLANFTGIIGAALIVGLVALVLGIGLIYGGATRLKATDLAPRRMTANLKRDVESLKGD